MVLPPQPTCSLGSVASSPPATALLAVLPLSSGDRRRRAVVVGALALGAVQAAFSAKQLCKTTRVILAL